MNDLANGKEDLRDIDQHPVTVFFEKTKPYRHVLEVGFWLSSRGCR